MICLVIPAFNEAENIPGLLADLVPRARELGARVIIVDDGSTDGTYRAIQEHCAGYPITVVRHHRNRGVGGAVDSGIRVALGDTADDDVIVTLEADGTSDLDDLPTMLTRINQGYDVVLASFFAPGGRLLGVNRLRIAMSKTLAACLRFVTRLKEVHTFSYLYRAYRAGTLRGMIETYGYPVTREPGFPAAVELLLKLSRTDVAITEVPSTNDWNRRRGSSKLRIVPTLMAYARLGLNHLVGTFRIPRRSSAPQTVGAPADRRDVVEVLGEVTNEGSAA